MAKVEQMRLVFVDPESASDGSMSSGALLFAVEAMSRWQLLDLALWQAGQR